MIMEKFNDSLGNIPSSPFQLEKIEEPEPDPPKPKHFKIESDTEKPSISMDNLLGELQDYIEELKTTSSDPYGIPGPSNTSTQEIISYQEGEPSKVEQQDIPIPEPKINPASIPILESPKLVPIKKPPKQSNPEEVRLAKQKARKEAKELKELEQANLDKAMRLTKVPLLSKEEMIDDMYNKAEKYYAKYIDDSGDFEFDWVCLNEEIKAHADRSFVKRPINTWSLYLIIW